MQQLASGVGPLWGVLAVVLAVSAPVSWWAAWQGDRRLMVLMKPLPMLALIGLVLLVPGPGPVAMALLLALVCGLVGDVALLDPPSGDPPAAYRLPLGLGAFLLGHLAYLAAIAWAPQSGWPFPWPGVVAGPLALVLAAVWGRPVARAAGALRAPVIVYQAVILTLLIAAAARGPWVLVAGAAFFVASDLMLGRSLFLATKRWHGPAVMVTYHLAQVLLVVGLLVPSG